MATLAELQDALVNADKAGATDDARMLADAIVKLKGGENKPKFGEQLNAEVADVPRQLGLTVRHGIEGLAGTAGIFSDPIAATSNIAFGTKLPTLQSATASMLDSIGLPKPQNATERVVGDASRLLAGTGGMIKGATSLATKAPAAADFLSTLAAKPALQASSAVGSGAAGGYTRETGGDGISQFLASVAGGLATPAALAGVSLLGENIVNAGKNVLGSIKGDTPELTIQVNDALAKSGLDFSKMSLRAKQSLADDVAQAIKIGGDLQPDAIRRLAAYRNTGAVPTAGTISLDPSQLTRQVNLAKVGANSTDPKLQQLANIQRGNDQTLIGQLNNLADTVPDAYSGAQKIMSALQAKADAAKNAIGSLYNNARETGGRSALLDHVAFTNRANDLLDSNLLGGQLPSDVRNTLNSIAQGKTPLTVDVAEGIKTAIGKLQRASSDGSVRMALGNVRQALDEAPLLEGQGQQAIDAFNAARNANRQWMQKVEATPALKAVVDGVEPDKFVQQYIVGGGNNANVMDVFQLRRQLKDSPEAIDAVKGQITRYLKESALGKGNPDDMANFSASGYTKALEQIGERKLRAFFSKDEIQKLKDIGTVAKAEKFQPTGAAINNSNSGTTLASYAINALDALGNTKIGAFLPTKNITASLRAGQALNVPQALRIAAPNQPIARTLAIPSLMALQGGLLTP